MFDKKWFLTGPLTRVSEIFAEFSKRQNCWRILEDVCRTLLLPYLSALPIGCNDHCWVSGYSNELSSDFEAPVQDGARRHQTSEGERNVALSFSLSWKIVLPFHTRLCGRSFFLQNLYFSSVLKFRSTRTSLMRIRTLSHTLR